MELFDRLALEVRERYGHVCVESIGNLWRASVSGWHVHVSLATTELQLSADGATLVEAVERLLQKASSKGARRGTCSWQCSRAMEKVFAEERACPTCGSKMQPVKELYVCPSCGQAIGAKSA